MSLSQLRKCASGRRDDLEQLIYTLAFLAKGDLPWSLKRAYATEDVLRAKATPSVLGMVFEDLPDQFREAYEYVKALEFEELPDYDYIKHLFLQILTLH